MLDGNMSKNHVTQKIKLIKCALIQDKAICKVTFNPSGKKTVMIH